MRSHSIVITDGDMERLGRWLRGAQHSLFRDQLQIDSLEQLLENADVRPPHRTPKSVVRINSTVWVRDFETRKQEVYTVVVPDEANVSLGLISVLAPVGIALIGQRRGSLVEVIAPGRTRKLRIVHVSHTATCVQKEELPLAKRNTPPSSAETEASRACQ